MKQIKVLNKKIYINEKNGSFSFNKEDVLDDEIPNVEDYIYNFKSNHITLCINISNTCNLNCKYCFNQIKNDTVMDINYIKSKIREVVDYFKDIKRFYIDLSGKGEPLLNYPIIIKIADYCKFLSKKNNKNIIVSFVTNGTLLNKKIINRLQKKNILFGISLDGNKDSHDYYRKDKIGKPTYDLIMKNIEMIKKKEYLGCAVTITNRKFDLLHTLLELSNSFETISIKPVRDIKYGFNEESLRFWIGEYQKLTNYFVDEIKKNRWNLLKKLINGDDYFGKFVYRCFLNVRVFHRCDAKISRFTLEEGDKLYGCPASTIYSSLKITTLDFKRYLNQQINSNKNCEKCTFFYYCGGECEIERIIHIGKINNIMCGYKKELIKFAMYLKLFSLFEYPKVFLEINSFCQKKMNRKL